MSISHSSKRPLSPSNSEGMDDHNPNPNPNPNRDSFEPRRKKAKTQDKESTPTQTQTRTQNNQTDRSMPPPPPRPANSNLPPFGRIVPMSNSGSGFGSSGLPPRKPIILSKPIGFNVFAKKPNGFTLDETPPRIPSSRPFPSLSGPNGTAKSTSQIPTVQSSTTTIATSDIDPLEAFMSGLAGSMTEDERKAVNGESEAEERRQMQMTEASQRSDQARKEMRDGDGDVNMTDTGGETASSFGSRSSAPGVTVTSDRSSVERIYGDEDGIDESVIEHHNHLAESGLSWLEKQAKIKKKEIKSVDHDKMNYLPFRKDFYRESKEITQMSEEEVRVYRETVMEGVKIRGKNCPKPIRSWLHCGLPDKVYSIIQREGYKSPFPIQQQAIPAIMSGRDVIACAKTGSGKTLAFVLPMLRHVLDQPLVAIGEGPIAIILAPTRELATQIYNECKKFTKPLSLRLVCVYGGASVGDQITQLKRGAEIIVATPGRMIDMLVTNKGNLTNLHRATYVVLDEADRMFDMGFEPQVCLAGETQVTIAQTLLSRPIDSLKDIAHSNNRVLGFNGTSIQSSQPVAWTFSGHQDCVRVTLMDGREIVCTPTHRLMTPYGWKQASQLNIPHDRILCSVDAISDRYTSDEKEWNHTIGVTLLSLHNDTERDVALAFMRTLGSSTSGCSSSIPSFLLLPTTPICIIREFLRSFLGRIACAPELSADGDGFSPVTLSIPSNLPYADEWINQLHNVLLSRFEIPSTIVTIDFSISLEISTIPFAQSLGFVHANDKSFRLAVATAYEKIQLQHCGNAAKCNAREFLSEAGCLNSFLDASKFPSNTIPVFHLPIHSITPTGVYPTYDIQVSHTHSFLASNILVHNCKIIENIRPDRQTVLFSATFPKSIESLAKKTLKNPVEIIIGGRSVASSTITQFVEVREKSTKFPRLLEILGQWYKLDSCILIFVDKQESVDSLFRQLNDAGYPCAALHGGMDQSDRDFTLADFKSKIRTIMVATSVVARGLDVKDLTLVVNYTVPNHYEDYVHRVGRTGRAGKSGTAITFIEPSELKYAPDLVKGLSAAKQVVPKDLQKMGDEWNTMIKEGKVSWRSNDGFHSHTGGYKFDEAEAAENKNQRRLLKMAESDDADLDELAAITEDARQIQEAKQAKNAARDGPATFPTTGTSSGAASSATPTASSTGPSSSPAPGPSPSPSPNIPKSSSTSSLSAALDPIARQIAVAKKAAQAAAQAMAMQGKLLLGGDSQSALEADQKVAEAVAKAKEDEMKRQANLAAQLAQQTAAQLALKLMQGKGTKPVVAVVGDEEKRAFNTEVEINDYPQQARWSVTHKGALDAIIDETECAVTPKGGYFPPGRNPTGGERKLHLLIEGRTEMGVQRCRAEIVRMLEESAREDRPVTTKYGKYTVV